MKKSISIVSLAILAPLAAGTAMAQQSFVVQLPVKVDAAGGNADRLKSECKIDTLLANAVVSKVSGQFPGSGSVEGKAAAPGGARVLRLTITGAYGLGGGAYSGTKQMSVRAEILSKNKVVATTVRERQSMGGAAGLFGGGTCAVFGKLAEVLAQDITVWMSNPI